MEVLGILIPLSILAVLAILIAVAVYIVTRIRSGEPLVLSFRTILLAYLYLMSIASLLVFAVGLSTTFKALSSDLFGREFSYWTPPATRFAPARPVAPGQPMEPDLKPQPVPEEERERDRRQVERQYQEDLIQGGTLVVAGGLIWAFHLYGRRRGQVSEEASQDFFHKSYLTILLVIFSIVGIIALPMAAYELLRFFILQPDEFSSRQPPGATVGIALVFVPGWVAALLQVMRRTRLETS